MAPLVRALDREVRSRPYGAIRALERTLGKGRGWWQNRVASKDLTVRQLVGVLDFLGLDRIRFLRDYLAREDGLEFDRPAGPQPKIIVRAWDRFRSEEPTPMTTGAPLLDLIDEQRYTEPAEALRLSELAIPRVEAALLPRLMGIIGSSFRLLCDLSAADHAFCAGIEMASRSGDQASAGNLLRRLSYVRAEFGDYEEALSIVDNAALTLLRCGDELGLAKASVERGIWLYCLDRMGDSIEAQTLALRRLPESEIRYRCAACQYLGLCNRRLGNLEDAQHWLGKAKEASGGIEVWAQTKLLWLEAEILADLGKLDDAERAFARVVEVARVSHAADAALATCSLVRIQLMQFKSAEAYESACTMRALVEPLSKHPQILAAIVELLRAERTSLTLALVERVKEALEGERQAENVLNRR